MNAFIKVPLTALLIIGFNPIKANLPDKKSEGISSTKNPSDTSIHPLQISFVPYFGTNGFQSDSIITNFSINILAGIVYEVKSAEFGGMINIVRRNAGSCQLAGIGNIVLGKSTGFQGAGTFNFSNTLDGIQVAGIINSVGHASGIQISGMVNHASQGKCDQIAGLVNNNLDTAGMQITELLNIAHKASLFQLAGIANVAEHTPFQIAGCANYSQKTDNFQIAGIINNTASGTKLQIAGLINNAKQSSGSQISGLINKTKYFNGFQIGLINIADSCNGLPIGILSIVKNGYHKLEISGDELFCTNIAFRSGIQKFHSIIIAGIQSDNLSTPLWTYGFGLGSQLNLSEKTLLGFDIISQQIIKGDHIGENYLYKIGTGIDRKIAKKMSIYLGVTYNFLLTDKRQSKYESIYSSIAPYSFTDNENKHFNLKTWAGFKLGLRFF